MPLVSPPGRRNQFQSFCDGMRVTKIPILQPPWAAAPVTGVAGEGESTAQPLAALPPYGCGVPLAGKGGGIVSPLSSQKNFRLPAASRAIRADTGSLTLLIIIMAAMT